MSASEIYKKALHSMTSDAAVKVVQLAMHEAYVQSATDAIRILAECLEDDQYVVAAEAIDKLRTKQPEDF